LPNAGFSKLLLRQLRPLKDSESLDHLFLEDSDSTSAPPSFAPGEFLPGRKRDLKLDAPLRAQAATRRETGFFSSFVFDRLQSYSRPDFRSPR